MTTRVKNFNRLSTRLGFLIIIALFLASCKTGSSVSDKGIVQKRKYQKGFYVNVKSPFDKKQKLEENSEQNAPIHAEAKTPKSISSNYKSAKLQKPNHSKSATASKIEEPASKFKSVEEKRFEDLEASTNNEVQGDVFTNKHSFYKQDLSKDEATVSPQITERYQPQRLNTLALLSFIFGVLCWLIFGIPFSIAAVVCGMIGIIQIEKSPDIYRGQGFAIAGLILGLIALILLLLVISMV